MTVDPSVCRCTIGTISYEQVNEGTLWCRSCGRIWDLTQYGWKPDPAPPSKDKPKKKWAGKKKKW